MIRILLYNLFILYFFPPIAFAQLQETITVESDTAQYLLHEAKMIYKGQVEVHWLDRHLQADQIILFKAKDGTIHKMEATGKPATFTGKLPSDQSNILGKAKKIIYLTKTKELLLQDDAQLNHHEDEFTAPTIHFNLEKNSIVANKNANTRPKIVFDAKGRA